MDFSAFFKEGALGSLNSVINMAKIVIPLMIIMELLKDLKVLEKVANFLKPIAKFFGISKESTFPLVVGLIFGLAYGAGVIIDSINQNDLPKKDLYVVVIFLIACHAVFEDTLLFVAIGANGILLLSLRLGAAIVSALLASKVINKMEMKEKDMSNFPL